jgi:hypothetical protein
MERIKKHLTSQGIMHRGVKNNSRQKPRSNIPRQEKARDFNQAFEAPPLDRHTAGVYNPTKKNMKSGREGRRP